MEVFKSTHTHRNGEQNAPALAFTQQGPDTSSFCSVTDGCVPAGQGVSVKMGELGVTAAINTKPR